ncbi:MAG: hypothetical protein KBC02_03285 [Candidatus Pacebacteria bacterium]|nr:hypothetical protein [Candidatus Paceibacterota bacterium]
MKKLSIFLVVLALSLGSSSSASASSSTITLSPAAKSVAPGQTVTVSVQIIPNGSEVTTVKAKISFPADILEVQKFTFGDEWLPLTQPGYSVTDNVGGLLVRTAGFPGGLTTAKTLGTIAFRVKAAGSASIIITSDSLLLDPTNVNVFSASSASMLTSVQTAATPVPVINKTIAKSASPSPSVVASSSSEIALVTTSDREAAIGTFLGLDVCSSAGQTTWWITMFGLAIFLMWFGRTRGSYPLLILAYFVIWALWAVQICSFGFAWLPAILGGVSWLVAVPRKS